MAQLSASEPALSGTTIPFSSASSGGDTVKSQDGLLVVVRNDDTAGKTVTIASQVAASPGVQPADVDVNVAAGDVAVIPVGGNNRFADNDELVQITYSATTSVEVAAMLV